MADRQKSLDKTFHEQIGTITIKNREDEEGKRNKCNKKNKNNLQRSLLITSRNIL